jgi:shikimate dehydrogenase
MKEHGEEAMSIRPDPQTPIDTHTKLVGLLGRPLGHSLSPAMHNRAFQALGLNYCYLPIEVTARDLPVVTAGIARMNFAGYNVTIPHKIRVMDCLDAIDPLARAIGAVNTVTIEDGRSTGYNTDGIGFLQSLEAGGGLSVADKSILVLGSGGAARAIAMTLAREGAARVAISNRTVQKARALADDVNRQGRTCCEALALQKTPLAAALRSTDILVNTTSVGMHPDSGGSPIDSALLPEHLVVCDIVYNPRRTLLLETARQKGCRIVEGLGMLVYQGAASFRLWTGRSAPIGAMFAACDQR